MKSTQKNQTDTTKRTLKNHIDTTKRTRRTQTNPIRAHHTHTASLELGKVAVVVTLHLEVEDLGLARGRVRD